MKNQTFGKGPRDKRKERKKEKQSSGTRKTEGKKRETGKGKTVRERSDYYV